MSEKRMLELLNYVEDSYLEEANPRNMKKKLSYKKVWWIAAAACVCLLITIGYGVSLSTKEPYNALDINTEEAIAVVPYGDITVCVFQKEIQSSHDYAFGADFVYKDISYHLDLNTNDDVYIYEMVETIIGEAEKHVFSDVLGFDSYYVKAEEPFKGFVNWKYFVEIDSVETCVAEVFGDMVTKPEIYQKDLDGDGASELICSSMYGTGVQRIYIFRNHNGVIEVGYLCYNLWNEAMFPGIINRGSGYVQEVYHPQNGSFEIIYTVEDGTRSVLLENLEWVEFVPFEKGYF